MTTTCTFSFDDLDNFEAFSSRVVAAFSGGYINLFIGDPTCYWSVCSLIYLPLTVLAFLREQPTRLLDRKPSKVSLFCLLGVSMPLLRKD